MKIADILRHTHADYIKRVREAHLSHSHIVDHVVSAILNRLEQVKQKPYITAASDYIPPVAGISIYMRYGSKRYGRYGHDLICISNITLPDHMQRDGVFTAILFALIAECQERKIILSVENPLEKFFQDFLLHVGFICPDRNGMGIGTFYYLLREGQKSLYPFYNMEPEYEPE